MWHQTLYFLGDHIRHGSIMTNHDVGSHDFMHSLCWNYELPHGVIALSEFPRGPSVEVTES